MKVSRLARRLSVSAPRMTVKSHVPLPVRLAVALVALAAAVGAGAWFSATRAADAKAIDHQVDAARLRDENAALRGERDRLLATSDASDSRATMDRSTVKELGEQVARLEAENAKLKEDVAFFEAATTERGANSATAKNGVAIRRFQVVEDKAAHVARYRILLTQDSKAARDFAGDLQLVVTLSREGKAVTIALPEKSGPEGAVPVPDSDPAQFRLAFRSYKRVEGVIRIPVDASLKTVQAKVLERGAVLAQQTVAAA